MPSRLFSLMTPAAASFYHKILNRVLLNLHAVKHGLFDTRFCETDDPRVFTRWTEAVPKIIQTMYDKKQGTQGDQDGR